MSRDTNKLSLDDQDKLDWNIHQVEGVLELLFCALSSENPVNDSVLPVIYEAQDKMKKIYEAVQILTAV